jgi:uncharacterized protein (DUF427 family)
VVKAVWNDAVLAASDGTVIVEGIIISQTSRSNTWGRASTAICPWQGNAHYYSIAVGGSQSPDAAW